MRGGSDVLNAVGPIITDMVMLETMLFCLRQEA